MAVSPSTPRVSISRPFLVGWSEPQEVFLPGSHASRWPHPRRLISERGLGVPTSMGLTWSLPFPHGTSPLAVPGTRPSSPPQSREHPSSFLPQLWRLGIGKRILGVHFLLNRPFKNSSPVCCPTFTAPPLSYLWCSFLSRGHCAVIQVPSQLSWPVWDLAVLGLLNQKPPTTLPVSFLSILLSPLTLSYCWRFIFMFYSAGFHEGANLNECVPSAIFNWKS